jgi:hypothetical protein
MIDNSTVQLGPNLKKFLQLAMKLTSAKFAFSALVNYFIREYRPYLDDYDTQQAFMVFYFGIFVVLHILNKVKFMKKVDIRGFAIIYFITTLLQEEFVSSIAYEKDREYSYNNHGRVWDSYYTYSGSILCFFFFYIFLNQTLSLVIMYKMVNKKDEISYLAVLKKFLILCNLIPVVIYCTYSRRQLQRMNMAECWAMSVLAAAPFIVVWTRSFFNVIVKKIIKRNDGPLTMEDAVEFSIMCSFWTFLQMVADLFKLSKVFLKMVWGLLSFIWKGFCYLITLGKKFNLPTSIDSII